MLMNPARSAAVKVAQANDHAALIKRPFPEDVDPFFAVRVRSNTKEQHLVNANIVLSALTEVLLSNGVTPQSTATQLVTAYFGALMVALEQRSRQTEEQLSGTIYLLSLLFPSINTAVLRSKFESIALILIGCIEEQSANTSIVKAGLTCVQILISSVESPNSAFNHETALKLVQTLLLYTVDSRPKLRHHAQAQLHLAVQNIHASNSESIPKAVQDLIVSFAVREFQQTTNKQCQEALWLCGLFQLLVEFLSLAALSSVFESLLSLVNSRNSVLYIQCMRTLAALGERGANVSPAKAKEAKQAITFMDRLLTVLLTVTPHPSDIEATIAFSQAIISLITRFASLSPIKAGIQLVPYIASLSEMMTSPKPTVVKIASSTVVHMLHRAVSQEWVAQCPDQVELLVKAVEALLGYRHKAVWSNVWPIITALFASFPSHGDDSFESLSSVLELVDGLRADESILKEHEAAINECFGAAIAYHSPATVLSICPLNLPLTPCDSSTFTQQLTASRAWLLPVIRTHTRRTTLSTFFDQLLPIITTLDQLSTDTSANQSVTQQRAYELLAEQIWECFPSFCQYPTDLTTHFKTHAKTIGSWLSDQSVDSVICTAVCRGLCLLIQKYQWVIQVHEELRRREKLLTEPEVVAEEPADDEGAQSEDEEDEVLKVHQTLNAPKVQTSEQSVNHPFALDPKTIDEDEANQAIKLIGSFGKNFLPLLFNLMSSNNTSIKRDLLLDTIAAFASVSESTTINNLFKRALAKWLEAIKPDVVQDEQRAQALSDIVLAMINQLDSSNQDLLLRSVEPQLSETDPNTQKKAYKILSVLCTQSTKQSTAETGPSFFDRHWRSLLALMASAAASLHSSALKWRLLCIRSLCVPLPDIMIRDPSLITEILASLPSLIGEVLLALKEPSFKTRSAAYDFVNSLGRACFDADQKLQEAGRLEEAQKWPLTSKDTDSPLLSEYVLMLLGGLAGASQSMQSATIMAFSHLIFAFRLSMPKSISEPLIPTLLPLLTTKSREVRKSMLGAIKVICLYLDIELVRPHLPTIIPNLSDWGQERKNRFQEKVRVILDVLIRKVGIDLVKQYLPQQHHALVNHIKKTKDREQRQKTEAWMERKAKREQQAEDSIDHPTRKVDFESQVYGSDAEMSDDEGPKQPVRKNKRRERSRDDGMSVSENVSDLLESSEMIGALRKAKSGRQLSMLDTDEAEDGDKRKKKWEVRSNKDGKLLVMDEPSEGDDDHDSDMDDDKPKRGKKRGREEDDSAATLSKAGVQYKGKNGASGDARRAGQKLEPYAYVPLNAQMLNKRKRASETKKMQGVVSNASNVAKQNRQHQRAVNDQKKGKKQRRA